MYYHVLIGFVWAWFLREKWGEFNLGWIWLSIIGSLLPDIDHFFYFFTYGKYDSYTQQLKGLILERKWRRLSLFVSKNHKFNTELTSHNLYFIAFLFGLSFISSIFDWQTGMILFGAMILHYTFDIFDDLMMLGTINPNWKRWGRKKKI